LLGEANILSDAELFANTACFGKVKCNSAMLFAKGTLDVPNPASTMVGCSLSDIKRRWWTSLEPTVLYSSILLSFAIKRLHFALDW
jgi:hypothetical protein